MKFPMGRARTFARIVRVLASAILLLAGLPACSEKPTDPILRSIAGNVVLRGYFIDVNGRPAGTRVIGDADGVKVDLVRSGRIIASTTTVDGSYLFTGLPTGVYNALTVNLGGIHDTTAALTIAVRSVAVADTLRMYSRGDLYPVPNPFVDSTVVYLEVPDTVFVTITIRDLAGRVVRSVAAAEMEPGLRSVTWDGRDDDGAIAPGTIHWMVYESGDDLRAHLLFR